MDGAPFFEGLPGGDVALVIGNEARGVSEGVRALATHRLKLPMPGRAESLNAAVAAGIMIYACISGGGERSACGRAFCMYQILTIRPYRSSPARSACHTMYTA